MKDTRKMILHTAFQLYKEKGYENVGVVDICRACNITKGTFYYHFPNKDELAFEFYESMYEDFSDMFMDLFRISNAKEQLWKVYEYSIDRTIALTPQVLKALFLSDIQNGLLLFSPYNDYTLDTHTSRQLKLQIDIVKRGQEKKEIKEGDAVLMVRTYVSALIGIAIAWSSNGGPFDEKEELKKVFDFIF